MIYKVFISSVQKEFAKERKAICSFFENHPLLHEYFSIFLFEDGSASGSSAQEVYIDEVNKSDIYLGLFGTDYGYEFDDGLSPTEKEYAEATRLFKERWIYIMGAVKTDRHPKMQQLIDLAGEHVVRKRVLDLDDLIKEIEKSAFTFLKQKGIIESNEFDNSLHAYATLDDIDPKRIQDFIMIAGEKRNFPLAITSTKEEVLTHLGLMRSDKLCNSALLVFAKHPQQFFPTATVKCAHFHGTKVQKPIPDLKEFGGAVSEMAAFATDFVLSKIYQHTGDRSLGNRVDTSYEIPRNVIAEAIINAVAHRDYLSKASVQVSVFKDRVEIWNPGTLPPGLSIDKLKEAHGSFPKNPLLAKCLFNTGDIERYGTGTIDIFESIKEAGLPEPVISLNNEFKITLWRAQSEESVEGSAETLRKDFVKISQRIRKQLGKRTEEVYDLLDENPEYTAKEIGNKLFISERTVQGHLARLKDAGYIKRIGPNLGGYWELQKRVKN